VSNWPVPEGGDVHRIGNIRKDVLESTSTLSYMQLFIFILITLMLFFIQILSELSFIMTYYFHIVLIIVVKLGNNIILMVLLINYYVFYVLYFVFSHTFLLITIYHVFKIIFKKRNYLSPEFFFLDIWSMQ